MLNEKNQEPSSTGMCVNFQLDRMDTDVIAFVFSTLMDRKMFLSNLLC